MSAISKPRSPQLAPGDDEVPPVRRRQAAPPAGADGQRCGGNRDDTGNPNVVIADDEDHIGKGNRQRRFGQTARAQNRDEQGDTPTGDIPGRKTAAELPHKRNEPVDGARRPVAGQHRDGKGVDRDRRGVVEKALALDQSRQAAGGADVVEDRDDRDRVCGRDDRAEDYAGQNPDRRDWPQCEPDDKGADDHADDSKDENRPDLVAQLADIDVEGRFEQQRRQEDVEQRLGAEPEIVEPSDDVADDIPGMGREGEVGDAPDGDADYGEQDRVRDRQALGKRQQQADQPEQGSDGKNGLDGIGHGGRPPRPYRQPLAATRRTVAAEFDGFLGAPLQLTGSLNCP